MKDWINTHSTLVALMILFFGSALMLVLWPGNEELARFVEGGAFSGAIIMYIRGDKKPDPPAGGAK